MDPSGTPSGGRTGASSAQQLDPDQRGRGVGSQIIRVSGKLLGRAVLEEKKSWKLDDGRLAHKSGEGKKWFWALHAPPPGVSKPSRLRQQRGHLQASEPMPVTSALAGELEVLQQDGDTEQEFDPVTPSSSSSPRRPGLKVELLPGPGPGLAAFTAGGLPPGVSGDIYGLLSGKKWGCMIAEDLKYWKLDTDRFAKKSAEGIKWRWEEAVSGRLVAKGHNVALRVETGGNSSGWGVSPEVVVTRACDWLPLQSAIASMACCRQWAAALRGRIPLSLPPPQVDLLMQFLLLHVLSTFNTERLPFPMSAIYSQMRVAARQASASIEVRTRLEAMVLKRLGPSCRSQQDKLLDLIREGKNKPHHVAMVANVKKSSHQTLERFARHFETLRVIQVNYQRPPTSIPPSPNLRTCRELLLTKVNRSHALFLDHKLWLQQAVQQPQ
ncbi:unnamed protein product [Polarella glacialis]|uniref:Uncharacterized protein n=1 Tax=Polarella glacialis TaxID=89957 RepID=A0A813LSI3_POLGL|nr:unnamed protein product [Polarella glacialis]